MLEQNQPYEDDDQFENQHDDRRDDDFFNRRNEPLEYRPWNMELNQFCMLMHLSQLAGVMMPFAGFVLSIVMWATNKDQSYEVDQHGKNIINWMISLTIYTIICTILIFVLIGIPMLVVLWLASLIFTILGAVKANDGVFYKYPLAIEFLK